MSDRTQTAVEWLVQQKTKYYQIINVDLEQAKAMEKQQAFEFWQGGIACTEEGGKSFDQFYADKYNDK